MVEGMVLLPAIPEGVFKKESLLKELSRTRSSSFITAGWPLTPKMLILWTATIAT
jgi:hypothetical protein